VASAVVMVASAVVMVASAVVMVAKLLWRERLPPHSAYICARIRGIRGTTSSTNQFSPEGPI
jgi:hypothetical protein